MFSYIILIVCSIFIARFLEKRYKVATIAHAILFIVASVIHLFTSNVSFTMYAMQNIVGKYWYEIVRSVFEEGAVFFNITISSILVVEIISYIIFSIFAIVSLIKGFKKLIKYFQVKNNNPIIVSYYPQPDLSPIRVQIDNSSKTYLMFGRLLN